MVEAYPAGSRQFIYRLAVSGPTLVGGSDIYPYSASAEQEVRVWDLETLRPLHTMKQPGRRGIWCGRWWGTGERFGGRWVRRWWCGGGGDDGRRGLSDGWCWAAVAQVALCDFESMFLLVGIC